MDKIKEVTLKIYTSTWFLPLINLLFFIHFFQKDMWGSLLYLFILNLIAINKIDTKE